MHKEVRESMNSFKSSGFKAHFVDLIHGDVQEVGKMYHANDFAAVMCNVWIYH